MILQFTKRKDGGALLRCVRADGSATWQRQDDNRAAFFPLHDLTHYAVETELGFGRGFYGLVADGWDIADTTGKGARGPLPDEAIEAEYIVGSLGAERSGDSSCTAEEFNHLASAFAKTRGRPEPRPLTDPELTRVRSRIDELFTRWRALPGGATLELMFDRPMLYPAREHVIPRSLKTPAVYSWRTSRRGWLSRLRSQIGGTCFCTSHIFPRVIARILKARGIILGAGMTWKNQGGVV